MVYETHYSPSEDVFLEFSRHIYWINFLHFTGFLLLLDFVIFKCSFCKWGEDDGGSNTFYRFNEVQLGTMSMCGYFLLFLN